MGEESNNNWKVYLQDIETGEWKEVGGVQQINLVPAEDDDFEWKPPEPVVLTFKLTRKDKRFLLEKVFCVKRYEVTETLFPRKKKRGSMRRRRKAARNDTPT